MYVVEALPVQPLSEFNRAYDLIGNEEEISLFKKNIGSLLLGALRAGTIELEEVSDFLSKLQEQNAIYFKHKALFESLDEDSGRLKADRQEALIEAASQGNIDRDALWAELYALKYFEPAGGSNDLMLLTKDGLAMFPPSDGVVRAWFSDGDMADEVGDHVVGIAKTAGLTVSADQYELIRDEHGRPKVLSDRTHISLGEVDEHGDYTPILTVLSEDHPVRQSQVLTQE